MLFFTRPDTNSKMEILHLFATMITIFRIRFIPDISQKITEIENIMVQTKNAINEVDEV